MFRLATPAMTLLWIKASASTRFLPVRTLILRLRRELAAQVPSWTRRAISNYRLDGASTLRLSPTSLRTLHLSRPFWGASIVGPEEVPALFMRSLHFKNACRVGFG